MIRSAVARLPACSRALSCHLSNNKMVRSVVSVALFSLFLRSVLTDKPCRSTFCFSLFSRRIDVDLNLFNSSEPTPIEDLIRQSGYPVESHVIRTHDGYELLYHRIPHGKEEVRADGGRQPVLLQHGLLGASSCWVLSDKSLAYSLADAGFDVWLGNARGNTYSRRHVKYDPDKDKKAFWDFSWHEMGYYDLPASIDYILNNTGYEKLTYIGHSMGTTMYFVLGSTRPEYMDKVMAMVALAPVAFPWNIRSPLANFLMRLHSVLNVLMHTLGIYEVFPYSRYMTWIDNNICAKSQFQFICRDILYFIGGFDDKELNRTSLTTVLQYMPAGASFKQLKHYRQISKPGTNFQQFDYGYIENLWKYGSMHPPEYNMNNIKAPVYMYYAMNDWLAVPEDVHHVAEHLPNLKRVSKVSDDQFNHLDFMWAIDAYTLVYKDVISTISNLTRTSQSQSIKLDEEDGSHTLSTSSGVEFEVKLVH